jgi:hypothetical protein
MGKDSIHSLALYSETTQTVADSGLKTATEYCEDSIQTEIDHIFRINQVADDPLTLQLSCIGASEIVSARIWNLHRENVVLKHSLKSLWRNYQYNQEYISLLLGSYSQDEFMSIASGYAEPYQENVSDEDLAFAGEFLSSLLGQPLCSTDLSLLLNVNGSLIDQKLQSFVHTERYIGE